MTDPIADMLTQIRNGLSAGKAGVAFPYSKFKKQLADLMVRYGIIEKAEMSVKVQQKFLEIKLKYIDGVPVVSKLVRVSKPGQRIYSKAEDIPRTLNGMGVTIVSTSKGLLTDQQARKERLGGEVICQIW